MVKNILVTGAGGAIGKCLTDFLIKQTNNNLILSYYSKFEIPNYLDTNNERFTIIVGDIAEQKNHIKMFENADILIHLASSVNPQVYNGAWVNAFEYGAVSTFALLDYLRNTDKKIHVIFPSSGGTVYSENKSVPHKETDLAHGVSAYGIQKIMFENYFNLLCKQNPNISCNILRVSNPYGLNLNNERKQGFIDVAIHKILNNEEIEIWSPLNTIRDYIHIDDLCHAFHKAMEYQNGFSIFNIGSGTGTSLNDILNILQIILNQSINYKAISTDFYYPLYSVLDINKANKILNWKPNIVIKNGIENILMKHKEYLHA